MWKSWALPAQLSLSQPVLEKQDAVLCMPFSNMGPRGRSSGDEGTPTSSRRSRSILRQRQECLVRSLALLPLATFSSRNRKEAFL